MERRSAIEMMTDLLNTVRARCPRSADAILPFLQELNDHVKEQDLIIIQLAMMPRVSMSWTAAPENLNVLKN